MPQYENIHTRWQRVGYFNLFFNFEENFKMLSADLLSVRKLLETDMKFRLNFIENTELIRIKLNTSEIS
jgi:hypothetical protein